MSQINNSTKKRSFQHLDHTKRKLIEILLKKGYKQREIAKELGIAESTLSIERRKGELLVERTIREKELKRNYYRGKVTVVKEWEYNAAFADAEATKRKRNSVKHFKILEEECYVDFVEELVLSNPKQYSLDTANALARKIFKGVSTRTLYNWVEWDLMKIKTMDLLLKVRRKPKTKIKEQKRKYGKSIEERPKEVAERIEFGHWEGDSVVGKNGIGQIITFVERKSRISFMAVYKDRRAKNVLQFIRRLKKRFGEAFEQIFKSITFDNGSEFAFNKQMSRYTKIYYAHAYCAWERGSNENLNGILRRYIPKGSEITKLKQSNIDRLTNMINTMPRKILKYRTAMEVFLDELDNLVQKKQQEGFNALIFQK